MRKLFLPIFLLFIGFNATAQCLTAPNGQWPGATFTPTCTGVAQNITTAGWAGEYSMVNVVTGSSYTFSSSFTGDYITIGSSDGSTAYAFGTTPVTWTSTVTGPVRFYTHTSSACGAETVSRTRAVSCTNQACTGTPTAGTLSTTAASVCFGSNITLSLAGATSGEGGITIQWQSAPVASSTFTDLTAPNSSSYTFAPVQSLQYRAIINCSNSSLSDTSNIVQVDITNAPTYATFPYSQGFESWINGCSVNDRPDVHWANSPAIGNQSWRRDDQGVDGDWDFPNNGGYTPTSSEGSFSARFSTYSAASGTSGSLNLFIDLSTDPSPTKFLKFDYINTSGSDVLAVFVSTDGGLTFTQSGSNLGLSSSWTSKEFFINSTSATTVIRLRATSDFGVTDIGVDNLSIALGCSGAPTGGTTTATPASVCYGGTSVLSLSGASNTAGVTTQWQSSADGITWNDIPGATGASYNAPATGNFQYRALLTCVNGGLTATSTPATVTVTSQPTYATIPYAQSFENWIDGCSTTDRPDAHWGTIPSTTDSAWRRNDQGASANWTTPGNGTYSPASTDGSFSARFHTYFVSSSRSGIMDLFVDLSSVAGPKLLTFDYINTTGSDSLVLFLSENGGQTFTRIDSLRTRAAWANQEYTINSNSATAVLRFRATSDFGVTDIGIDDLRILVPCTGTPTAGTIAATGGNNFVCVGNSTTLNLSGQSLGTGLTYQWESSTDDVTFTPIAGATDVNLSVSPATSTYYRAVVTCTNGGAFAASPSLLIAVNDPQILTTTPGTRCGPGTVTLGATGTPGAVFNWYTDATGGAPIFTGDNFTTPVLNATTNYYVSAAQGGGSSDVGFLPETTNCGTTSTSTATDWTLRFNTTSPVTLNSVYVIPVAAGNFTVALRQSLSTTNIVTASFNFTAAQVGVPQKLDLGWSITNAGEYQLSNIVGGVTRIGTFTCNYPFTSAFGGLQIVGSATFSGSTTNTNTYNSFFLLNVSEGCESARQLVTATVTPGPDFDVTDDLAICNDATQALTVTSPVGNFDNYIWSPATNLFTDAAATIPYTGGSATTVYIKSSTADTYTYVVNAENTTSGCTGIDSVKVTVLPGSVTIAATPSQICVSGQAALSLNPATGYEGAGFQWQSSSDGTTFTDIAGATSQNYNTEVISTTTHYRVLIKDGAGVVCQQPTTVINVNSPSVLTTTPAALCGPGTMTLGATGTPGTVLNWYENATGGASVGTGTSFTTPNLTSTTTYYVSATAGGTIQGVGPVSVNDYPGASTNSSYIQGMVFDVFNPAGITIQSVDIFPTAPVGTNFQIVLRQGSGSAPVIATYQGTTTVTGTTTNPVAQTVPVNFNVPGGFDYVMTFYDGTLQAPLTGNAVYPGALRNSPATGVTFPQAIAGELSITASTAANTWNYFYNWRIGTGCESPRVAVEAQVSENTAITTQPVAQGVCSGASVTFTVAAVGANLSYQWRYNGADIAGATDATFTIPNASSANAGNYDVVITGLCGNVTSNSVSLAVSPTNGWIGVTNTDWNTASNWCGGIPTSTSDVVIPSGTPYQPIINGLASVRNLTISSGATVTLLDNGFLNIHGNYSNSGTFAAADGFVAFKGTTNQDVAAMNVGSLIMNGTGGITLAGNMIVNDALILENGNITLGSHSLSIMGASSTQNLNGSSKGSASSHIVTNSTGSVLVNDVSASTVVPVGPDAASYNPVTIGNGQGLDFTVRVSNGINPAIPYPAVAVNRTWTVTPGAAPGSPVEVTLQYADDHINAPGSPTATMQVGAHNGTTWNIVSPAAGLVPVGPATGRNVTIETTLFGPLVVTNIGGINIPTSLPEIDEDITSAVLMPNLIRSTTVLRVKAERTVRVDWVVVDMNGRVVMSISRQLAAGQTDIPLDFSRFANGNYIMAGFTKNGKLPVLKFVKQ